MTGRVVALLLAATAVLAGCDASSPPAGPQPVDAEEWQELRVAWHVDGDTVGVRLVEDGPAGSRGEEISVRLLEIDAPEVHPEQECYGPRAAAELARLLPRGARAWGEPDRELRDRYGRALLYLHADVPGDDDPEPVMVNLQLVRHGYAESVLFRPNDRHIDAMRAAEARARSERAGLWGACR